MTVDDEQILVRRAQQGEESAFTTLVERYKNRVFGLIGRSIPDRQRTEDLAQEVFLRIYRALPYFRGEARFSTWVYRIVVNLCVQEASRRPVFEVPFDVAGEDRGLPALQLPARDTTISDLELSDRLQKAMARLPPHYRLIIASHYLDGVGYEALAEALNMPLGTVKTHLHRAKRQLRRLLETELA
jgi:RNA polymerase sigma-70 factor, ECF subfamily